MFNRKNKIIKKQRIIIDEQNIIIEKLNKDIEDTKCHGSQLREYYDMLEKINTGYYEKASVTSHFIKNHSIMLKEIFTLLHSHGVLEDFYLNEYNLSIEQKITKLCVELGNRLSVRKESQNIFAIPGTYGKNNFTNYVRYLLNNEDLVLGEKEIDIDTTLYYAIKSLVDYEKTGEEKHLIDAKTFIGMKIKETKKSL